MIGGMDTETTTPTPDRTYFRVTTASQRRLLFRTVAEGGAVTAAARQAHVGRGTYYYWRTRYAAAGEAGLVQPRSCAPLHPRLPAVSAQLRVEVLTYYDEHPHERGGRTIAARLRQAHAGQSVIGHSAVAEILRAARATAAVTAFAPGAGSGGAPVAEATSPAAETAPPATVAVVHAPAPNQTANIDLCVVPVTHASRQAWVSVSVSEAAAGAMPEVVTPPATVPTWPGQVFADTSRPYADQMASYQTQRTAKRIAKGQRKHRRQQKQTAQQTIEIRSDELRVARRQQRQARQQQDTAWRKQRADQRFAQQQRRQQTRSERRAARAPWRRTTATWVKTREARQQQVDQRTTEDTAWRASRQEIRTRLAALAALPLVTVWLAILVVIDNGTRRSLQLPLFVTGVHVTAEEIIAQLQAHWPRDLQFVISDNGAQFIADAFAQFAKDMGFLHVRITPHRPQTNGIAERFVRTLKDWLAWHSWQSPEELRTLLAEFILYYNDRPHQGAELAGLSPNEFARQLGCSTC